MARHGTVAGWAQHKYLGEPPCDACVRARQRYDHRNNQTPRRVASQRLRARAAGLARKQLIERHKDEYLELYAAAKDELLGGDQIDRE